jgi:hypothetical protein
VHGTLVPQTSRTRYGVVIGPDRPRSDCPFGRGPIGDLGDPPEWVEVQCGGLIHVEATTALQTVNNEAEDPSSTSMAIRPRTSTPRFSIRLQLPPLTRGGHELGWRSG